MLLQQLINGLALGSTYSLLAIGYTLIFGILNILHIAHGEVFMVGAMIGLQLVLLAHASIYVALIGSMAGAAVLGLLIERAAIRTLRKAEGSLPLLTPLISTLGMSLILQDIAVKYTQGEQVGFPHTLGEINYHVGPVVISLIQILIIGVSLFLMVVLNLIVRRTKMGKAMRAVAEDMEAAQFMGINVEAVILFTFAIASALGGAAGILFGLSYNAVFPFMGVQIGLKGFAIIVIGGMGNIRGAIVGGLILGMVEVLSVAYLLSSYRDAFAFGLMVLILIFKPAGLFRS